ncbi:MAG: VOC family protein [Rhodocyclaceae bacterium]|nr:VOC family protein [Rhodocyclaceae bacterium]MBP6109504.1 VOC family protein [Rhodocyclaceae bacterium]MBP6279302.1 VOC family protein [Rhodocyclaceae bacterium]
MIGYVTVGTNDLARATAFYDALFATISGKRVFASPQGVVWSLSRISPGFGVFIPFDGKPATNCNGSMVALAMLSKKHVDDFYAKAISLGAIDEGQRDHNARFYINYFRDLDGNKLGAYYMEERRTKRRQG